MIIYVIRTALDDWLRIEVHPACAKPMVMPSKTSSQETEWKVNGLQFHIPQTKSNYKVKFNVQEGSSSKFLFFQPALLPNNTGEAILGHVTGIEPFQGRQILGQKPAT